jgi:TusA-related sulfurtransferase
MSEIDARGLNCPQPALMASCALKKSPGPLVILVDSESASESVLRELARDKRKALVEKSADFTTIKAEARGSAA